jgi:hypothetical protein
MVKKIFGLEKKEITGAWRKLHNEELNILYSSLDIVMMIN